MGYHFPISQFSKINVDGNWKYVYGDLPKLIREVKGYYPQVNFPISA
jgi:hypothetical protein